MLQKHESVDWGKYLVATLLVESGEVGLSGEHLVYSLWGLAENDSHHMPGIVCECCRLWECLIATFPHH